MYFISVHDCLQFWQWSRVYCPSGKVICFLTAYGHTKNVAFCKKAVQHTIDDHFCDRKCHINDLVFYDMSLQSLMEYQNYIYLHNCMSAASRSRRSHPPLKLYLFQSKHYDFYKSEALGVLFWEVGRPREVAFRGSTREDQQCTRS